MPRHRLRRCARRQAEPELRVLLAGAHELVGVRLDARRHAHEDRDGAAGTAVPRHGAEPVQLVERVDDDPADARLHGAAQLRGVLVVAVQHQPVGRHAGGQGGVQLAAGRHVEAHALFVHEPRHRRAQERLGGVGHAFAPGRRACRQRAPQMGLVVDEHRGPVLGGQRQQVDTADGDVPVGADGGAVGEQARPDRALVGPQPRVRGRVRIDHMRSGASMPRSASPVRMTRAVVSLSHRRRRRDSASGAFRTGHRS